MTKKTRKTPSNEKKSSNKAFRLQSTTYFLTYKGISDIGDKISKKLLADFLLSKRSKLCPEKYLICQQMYDSGEPHFHAIIIYPRRKQILHADYFDFMGIHPNIQPMRNMRAALQYVFKQDPFPLTNMDLSQQRRIARAKHTGSLYQLLEEQMLKDPIHFDLDDYCATHGLFKQIYKAHYTKAIALIRRAQPAYARMHLKQSRTGIKYISQELIHQKLNQAELTQYYSHPCYQKIVDHINQIHTYPNRSLQSQAPLKTRHLLITGGPDIGKTSLVYHRANRVDPHPGLSHYYPTYYFTVGQKYFPPYRSYDYSLVHWDEFTIVSDMFPKAGYSRLLNYLDGSVSALPQKGRPPVERQDNPKHILTSNRPLYQHIDRTFHSDESRSLARKNLPARVQCVQVPPGHQVHFLRKLFVAEDPL